MKQPQSFLFHCSLETLNSCNTNHCTSRSNMCAKIPTSSSRPTDHKSHQSGDATFGRGPFFICTLRRGGIAIDCHQLGHHHSVAARITPNSDLCQPTSSSGSTDHSLANQVNLCQPTSSSGSTHHSLTNQAMLRDPTQNVSSRDCNLMWLCYIPLLKTYACLDTILYIRACPWLAETMCDILQHLIFWNFRTPDKMTIQESLRRKSSEIYLLTYFYLLTTPCTS